MKILKWLNNRFVLITQILLWSVIDLILIGRSYDLSKSDWASWVGAIGTVATLVGTIWLATSSSRKQDREELELAVLTAAQFTLWISRMQNALALAKTEITLARSGSYETLYAQAAESIMRAEIWTTEDLKPLRLLPNRISAKLAFSAIRLKTVVGVLRKVSESPNRNIETLPALEAHIAPQFDLAIEELHPLQRACTDFCVQHGLDNDGW